MKQSIKLLTIACCIVIFTQMSLGQAIKVDSDGDVGIGGDPGTEALKVNGDLQITQDADISGNAQIDGNLNFNGTGLK
jgi:hypothetical protein